MVTRIQDVTCSTVPPSYCSHPYLFQGLSTLRKRSTSCHQIWLGISLFWFLGCWKPTWGLGMQFSVLILFLLPQDAQNAWALSLVLVQPGSGSCCCFTLHEAMARRFSPTAQHQIPSVLTTQHLEHIQSGPCGQDYGICRLDRDSGPLWGRRLVNDTAPLSLH